MISQDKGSAPRSRIPPPLSAAAGLRAVADVSRVKGSIGVAALREGFNAHSRSNDVYSLDATSKLRRRVEGLYEKKVAQRKKLATGKPTRPEDAASERAYGKGRVSTDGIIVKTIANIVTGQ